MYFQTRTVSNALNLRRYFGFLVLRRPESLKFISLLKNAVVGYIFVVAIAQTLVKFPLSFMAFKANSSNDVAVRRGVCNEPLRIMDVAVSRMGS